MNLFKCLSLMCLVASSLIFAGCESGDDNPEVVTTNVVVSTSSDHHDDESSSDNNSETNGVSTDSTPSTPPPPSVASENVIVKNDSSIPISVVFNPGTPRTPVTLAPGESKTWSYSGATFGITIDGASRSVADGLSHMYQITDDPVTPGLVVVRGSTF